MSRDCCLILVDLQNEFLSVGGRFPIHEASRLFLGQIPSLAAKFRAFEQPIFWVRAQYGCNANIEPLHESRQRDATNFLSGTHVGGTPCCEKGSIGAEFSDEIASLITRGDPSKNIIITKTWYSAFKETTLLAELKHRDIQEIFIGGLLSDICVSATALDAYNLGFKVTVLKDCLGWRKITNHDQALEMMLQCGIRIASSVDIDISEGMCIP